MLGPCTSPRDCRLQGGARTESEWRGWVWSTDESCQWFGSRALSHPQCVSSRCLKVRYDQLLKVYTPTRRGYWYQQDGASSHVAKERLKFLKAKFGDRVISRRTEHHWPPYSPDLSPLDFSFWSQAMTHLLRCQPSTIERFQGIVGIWSQHGRSWCKESDSAQKKCRALRSTFRSAGGHFQHLL